MRSRHVVAALAGTLALSACATVTPVVAVPGQNKDFAAFQKDDQACRATASQAAYGTATPKAQPGATTGEPGGSNAQWSRYFATLTECAAAHGDSVAPVPWTTAYAAYLGTPYAYPAFAAPAGYAYGYGPYGYGGFGPYGYYGDPFFFDYGYPFFGGFGYGFYGRGYYGHGWGGYRNGWGGGYHGGFAAGSFSGFHGGGGHR